MYTKFAVVHVNAVADGCWVNTVEKYIENYKNVSENKNSKIQKENSYADIVRGKKTLTQI